MSTDLVSWLHQAMLDLERLANRDEPGCNCRDLGCHHTELRDTILRTVAASRAILKIHADSCDCRSFYAGECRTLLLIAAIYQDRPGFDPSWRADG